MKKKYMVSWTKSYYEGGEEVIEADSREEAELAVLDSLESVGNLRNILEDSLEWNPSDSCVGAIRLPVVFRKN